MRSRSRRARLDAALAGGQDPWSSSDLRERAAQLGSLATRRKLAASLEALVTFAELQPTSPLVRSSVVLDHREALLDIAARLRDLPPVDVAVVARLAILVWDRASPAFASGGPPALFGEAIAGYMAPAAPRWP
jgi:hypothetical protein